MSCEFVHVFSNNMYHVLHSQNKADQMSSLINDGVELSVSVHTPRRMHLEQLICILNNSP